MSKANFNKIEEFLRLCYRDDLFTVDLSIYPTEKPLIIDYEELEKFDPNLADLLLSHPDTILDMFKRAINNMIDEEITVRFKNVDNEIPLLDLSSRHIGALITVEGRVKSVSKVTPKIHKGLFECKSCMRLHKIDQDFMGPIKEPALCVDCGSRGFNLLEQSSSFVDFQKCVLTNLELLGERDDPVNLNVILVDDLTKKLRVNDIVRVTGIYKLYRDSKNKRFENYLEINHIESIHEISDEVFGDERSESSVSRNSLEYTNWRNQVFQRDKVCQCCGLDKRLHAHHIFGYEEHPELAYEVSNGIILCQFCHDKYHSVYGLKDINPVKLAKFIRRFSSNGGALDDD